MEIGVLFDIDDLGGGFYGGKAWSVIMSALNPAEIANCGFFSGDTNIPGRKSPFSHCIGIEALTKDKLQYFSKTLADRNDKGLFPPERRFIEGELRSRYGLGIDARVDRWGRFILADTDFLWMFTVAAKNGWKCLPSDDSLGRFAADYLVHTCPGPDWIRRWDADFAGVARQAILDAGPKTLTALHRHLEVVEDGEIKSICQHGIKDLEALFPPEAERNDVPTKRTGIVASVVKTLFPVSDRQKCLRELEKAEGLARQCCWQPALWWATKALEVDPDCRAAKEVFMTSLANTAVGLVTIFASHKNKVPVAQKLLQRGHLNPQEAVFIADVMIGMDHLDELQNFYGPLLTRFNEGKIGKAARVPGSDLESARHLAAALGDERLPDQSSVSEWKRICTPESLSLMNSTIETQREALVILLQSGSPAQWPETCAQLHALFKTSPQDQELAAAFKPSDDDNLLEEAQFQRHRDGFQQAFAKNAARMMLTRSLFREPA